MPKDQYIEKLQNFIDVLTNFKDEIIANKYKFDPSYSPKQQTGTITSDKGKLYISSFCVTSVKSNCKKIEYIEKEVNGKIIKEKVVKHIFDPKIKQFVKGMLKYMENVFDSLVSVDDTNIPENGIDMLIIADDNDNTKADNDSDIKEQTADNLDKTD
jgi:hypothetical protein